MTESCSELLLQLRITQAACAVLAALMLALFLFSTPPVAAQSEELRARSLGL